MQCYAVFRSAKRSKSWYCNARSQLRNTTDRPGSTGERKAPRARPDLPSMNLDTGLPMWESDETTETTGSWCRRPWKRSRASRCSAGARHQNAMSSCGCCGASRSRPSRGRSGLSRSGSSSGRAALAALDAGLKDRPEDDPLQAVWAPPIAGGRAGHGKRTAAREDRPAGGWRASCRPDLGYARQARAGEVKQGRRPPRQRLVLD